MPHKLLLADDSVTIQRVIELTFADEDVEVMAVSDGDQAIAQLASEPPDIVLADVGMPGKTGYEVASHIKHTPALAHIPVLLLTGAFEPVDQARADAAGCDGVLAKPFEPQMVIGRVKELLARPARAAATAQAAPVEPTEVTASQAKPSEVAPGAVGPQTSRPAELDDYFQQLDTAFTKLTAAAPSDADEAPAADDDWIVVRQSPSESAPADAAWDLSMKREAVGPAQPLNPPVSGLSEAFATILAAEQQSLDPAAAPAWYLPRPEMSEDVVEQVAHRVLERLSDRVVRDAVSDLVSRVAERLVREEIERIKNSTQ